MKKLSQVISENIGAPHIANHYTPVDNIITMLKAFTVRMGIFIEKYQDQGLRIASSKFNTKEGLVGILCESYFDERSVNPQSIASYVRQCGLCIYVNALSESQVDVICMPDDIGKKIPGVPLDIYLT